MFIQARTITITKPSTIWKAICHSPGRLKISPRNNCNALNTNKFSNMRRLKKCTTNELKNEYKWGIILVATIVHYKMILEIPETQIYWVEKSKCSTVPKSFPIKLHDRKCKTDKIINNIIPLIKYQNIKKTKFEPVTTALLPQEKIIKPRIVSIVAKEPKCMRNT